MSVVRALPSAFHVTMRDMCAAQVLPWPSRLCSISCHIPEDRVALHNVHISVRVARTLPKWVCLLISLHVRGWNVIHSCTQHASMPHGMVPGSSQSVFKGHHALVFKLAPCSVLSAACNCI